MSIPRLELTAAVLGVRLSLAVTETLQMPTNNVVYWTSDESRHFEPFIANIIDKIHENTEPKQWRHVPTNKNPADLISRGTTASKLVDSTL